MWPFKKKTPPTQEVPWHEIEFNTMVSTWRSGDIFEFMNFYLMIDHFEAYNPYSGEGRNGAWCIYRDDSGVLREVRISARAMRTLVLWKRKELS